MKEYFIFIENKKEGPYTISELQKLNINSNTLIWSKGMSEWNKASDLNELSVVLENIPPPLPENSKGKFYSYMNHNFKYVLLTLILSFIAIYFLHNNFSDYMVNQNYGGYDSTNYQTNKENIDNYIQDLEGIWMFLVFLVGLLLLPFLYLFKKKVK